MKKILTAAVLALFLFTGCGNKPNATKPPTSEPPAQAEQSKVTATDQKLTWNNDDLNPMTSGNLETAMLTFRNNPDVQTSAVDVPAADVMRRPWEYYGQAVRFSGQIGVIQDYPPGHNISKALGGESCEIVMTADDGITIIDGILLGNTKGLQVGDYVTFCGYPCGVMEVANKIGGNFSHLVVVGKR